MPDALTTTSPLPTTSPTRNTWITMTDAEAKAFTHTASHSPDPAAREAITKLLVEARRQRRRADALEKRRAVADDMLVTTQARLDRALAIGEKVCNLPYSADTRERVCTLHSELSEIHYLEQASRQGAGQPSPTVPLGESDGHDDNRMGHATGATHV